MDAGRACCAGLTVRHSAESVQVDDLQEDLPGRHDAANQWRKQRPKMPSIRLSNVAAGTPNALDGLQFQDIPSPGALVSIYASTAVALGTISYSVGTERFLVAAEINIEIAVDAVDTQRDMVLDREPVPAGKQFLAVDGQVANLLVVIEDLPAG